MFDGRKLLLYSLTDNKSDELFRFAAKEIYNMDANLLGVNAEKYTDKEIQKKFNSYMQRGYYVIETKGKIVSQAVFARDLKKGKCISGVYTPKNEREKGYAYNLIYRLSKKALEEGAKYCVLYTDDENPISNHVYEKIGYRRMVDCEDIEFYK